MPDVALRVLDAAVPADAHAWAAAWAAWPEREVFAHPAYVRLGAGDGTRARCALAETPGGTVLYPFLQRDLPAEIAAAAGSGPTCDLTTPYGYGGPACWGDRPDATSFWDAFDAWAAREGVVSEFVRFHLDRSGQLPFPGTVAERTQNVVRTLGAPLEAIWMDAEHKVRKNVKRARRSGVTVEFDRTGERLGAFLDIYEATMDRRDAGASFYFPRAYFEAIHRDLPGQFVYAFAMHEGEAVSAELALVSATSLYSFLGGTRREAFALRPNDLLKVELMEWAKAEGLARFVLGGGYGADDGIYRYKKSFAPSGSVPFCVGTRVHDAGRYRALASARAAQTGETPDASFFPQYRA